MCVYNVYIRICVYIYYIYTCICKLCEDWVTTWTEAQSLPHLKSCDNETPDMLKIQIEKMKKKFIVKNVKIKFSK